MNQPAQGRVLNRPLMAFPFFDLQAQFVGIRAEVLAAVIRVLESQYFILGPDVETLERDVADLVGCRYAIGCASGSDALLLALMALEIGPRDEVITTPFNFVSTASSIARLGARPVFVDIDPIDFNVDPADMAKAITPRTRAILPAHLFGLPADMDSVLELARVHRLAVIEDANQAIGARHHGKAVGSMGTVGCFSFFPTKNLGGAGDGGMITTDDPELAERLGILRTHGRRRKYQYELLGINSRLDELQAAIVKAKLSHLEEWTTSRRKNAMLYRTLFTEHGLDGIVQLPAVFQDRSHVYNQFVIRTPRRDALRNFLRDRGIPSEIYYPYALHVQPAFSYLGYKKGQFPKAENACTQALALPIYPELSFDQLQMVVAAIAKFFAQ
jgi:dTDP-4-amino-4,6-dideoxygalactose transaminase